jgi:hypothetical protein
MFRLPRGVLDPEIARPYCYTDTASLIETDACAARPQAEPAGMV